MTFLWSVLNSFLDTLARIVQLNTGTFALE